MKPIQPIKDGRFVPNKIVERLLDEGPFNMNDIALWHVPQEDREQFAQLVGYSLKGFAELSYVSDETYLTADAVSKNIPELTARNHVLRIKLETVKKQMLLGVATLYDIHPDDLKP